MLSLIKTLFSGAGEQISGLLGGLGIKSALIAGAALIVVLATLFGYLYVRSLTEQVADLGAKLATEKIAAASANMALQQSIANQNKLRDTLEKFETARAATESAISTETAALNSIKTEASNVSDEDLRALNDASDRADGLFQAAGR